MRWGLDNGVPLTHWRIATELDRLVRDLPHRKALACLLVKIPGGMG